MATIPANIKAVNVREVETAEESESQQEAMDRIREYLRRLRFGAINVVVQDGIVVQIDRTEKSRLRKTNVNATGNRS